jgi:hypothetical protein
VKALVGPGTSLTGRNWGSGADPTFATLNKSNFSLMLLVRIHLRAPLRPLSLYTMLVLAYCAGLGDGCDEVRWRFSKSRGAKTHGILPEKSTK